MSIAETEKEIIDEFELFENDTFEKFSYLIDLGRSLKPLSSDLKSDTLLIKGCQANVWIYSELRDGLVFYTADADADYARGLVAMMIRVLSGHTPDEIITAKLEFIDKIGFSSLLSMKRSGGLLSMIKQMKLDALAFKARA